MQDIGCLLDRRAAQQMVSNQPIRRRRPLMRSAFSRTAIALLLAGSLSACMSPQPANADDSGSNAPKALTLDQPSAEPGPECKPLDPSAPLQPVQLKQSFVDDFSAPKLQTDLWETHYPGPDDQAQNRTLPTNSEQQIYVDRDFKSAGIDPFNLHDGMLSITVNKTPDALVDGFKGLRYTSGLITTRQSFQQTYGYFEIKARVPRGKALWPAFWLLRVKGGWPPEIDVMEVLNGNKPEDVFMTTHWKEQGLGKHQRTYCQLRVPDVDKAFHTYGVLWTEQRIVYYLDRKPIGQFATPAGLDHPMYMLANMAVQKGANEKTPMGASFDIDWIAAYEQ